MDARRLGQDRAAEDAALVERARGGDAAAFGELVLRYRDLAGRVARIVAPGAEVDDVVQEALVKAWYALPRFHVGAPFRPWLCRIVANEAKNRARSSRRRDALVLQVAAASEDAVPSPEAAALARDEAEALVEAMNRLHPDDRLVIAYRWLLDLRESETAEALGIPPGTVKSRLSRAMTKLRTQLAATDGGEP